MIGGPGPTPNLLRQYELGAVPKEVAEEHEVAEPHDGRAEEKNERTRRRWLRFWRRT